MHLYLTAQHFHCVTDSAAASPCAYHGEYRAQSQVTLHPQPAMLSCFSPDEVSCRSRLVRRRIQPAARGKDKSFNIDGKFPYPDPRGAGVPFLRDIQYTLGEPQAGPVTMPQDARPPLLKLLEKNWTDTVARAHYRRPLFWARRPGLCLVLGGASSLVPRGRELVVAWRGVRGGGEELKDMACRASADVTQICKRDLATSLGKSLKIPSHLLAGVKSLGVLSGSSVSFRG